MTNRIRDEQCPAADCTRGIQSAGYCDKHYRRIKRTGSLELPRKPTAAERFWMKVEKTPSCWEWVAHINPSGYGACRFEGKVIHAHRVSYLLTYGSLPPNKDLDHLCRNRKCVRPDHLEAVTRRVNILRGIGQGALHARKTHCKNGHPLSGDNIYPNQIPNRVCVTCARVRGNDSKRRRAPSRTKEETHD